jgi:uncharacterized membrane protein YbhN (UPF0104 family)
MKKKVKLLLKLIITTALIYFVFSSIDMDKFKSILANSNPIYLLLAFIFFNISKIISSIRLNIYFKRVDVSITEKENLILYYIGMFYNLALPGGIGGDGYKIYYLNKHYSAKVLPLTKATLFDRISGLVSLLFLMLIAIYFSIFSQYTYGYDFILIVLALLAFPSFYLFNKVLFKDYIDDFKSGNILAFFVQLTQVISAYFIILAINQADIAEYIAIFLLSSVVAVLPLTIGGIGSRELTFMYMFGLVGLDSSAGIAFSIIFFAITAISSLIGAFLKTPKLSQ